jgi:DNA-binding response OmpR family regulator
MKRRVLVLDDEPTILLALQRYLTRLGMEVDCASEMEEAEALLVGRGGYHVIIADLALAGSAGMEGLEFVRFARLHSPLTRIVMLTAHGSSDVELEARRRGVDVFIRKPRPLAEIAAIVTQLMEVSGQ